MKGAGSGLSKPEAMSRSCTRYLFARSYRSKQPPRAEFGLKYWVCTAHEGSRRAIGHMLLILFSPAFAAV